MFVPVTNLTRATTVGHAIAALLGAAILATPTRASAQRATTDSTVHWVAVDRHSDSTGVAQLVAAVQAARRDGRTPIVELGAPWCGPCHVLESVLRNTDMAAIMRTMSVISLNNDNWREALVALGFDAESGIPRLFVIDSTGHPVGEPWRPRDVPDSLVTKLGTEGAWRVTTTALFTKAQQQFVKHETKQ